MARGLNIVPARLVEAIQDSILNLDPHIVKIMVKSVYDIPAHDDPMAR
jgi:hypothetical protein